MRRHTFFLMTFVTGLSSFAAPRAHGIVDAHTPKILLHIQPATTKAACSALVGANCETGIVTEGHLGRSFVYLIVARGDSMPSVGRFQCGLDYDSDQRSDRLDGHGIDILEWHRCADFESTDPPPEPAWPEPLSGNLITWNSQSNCQTGDLAVAGYFYIEAFDQGRLIIIPRPLDALATVADCEDSEVYVPPPAMNWVSFSQDARFPGCNPCYGHCYFDVFQPIHPTTWSAIKALTR